MGRGGIQQGLLRAYGIDEQFPAQGTCDFWPCTRVPQTYPGEDSLIMSSKPLVCGCVSGLCPLCPLCPLSFLETLEVQTWGLCLEICDLSYVGFSGIQPDVEASLTKQEGWVCQCRLEDSWRQGSRGRLQSLNHSVTCSLLKKPGHLSSNVSWLHLCGVM